MPYANYHAARIRRPGDFVRIRMLKQLPNGIQIYGGPLKSDPQGSGKPQTYRFPKGKFTADQAKKWLKEHKIKYILFEAASGKYELSDLTELELIQYFKLSDPNNSELMKTYFREILSNRSKTMEFEKNLNSAFCEVAGSVLPDILNKKVRCRNAFNIINGKENKVKSFDTCEDFAPYLLQNKGSESFAGMVRFCKSKKLNKNEFEYDVFDYIPFPNNFKIFKSQMKFDDEKMQMFSLAYPAWESWHKPDSDDEYIKSEDLRLIVVDCAKNGIDLNIEHEIGSDISKDDAMIIEFYQARAGWVDGALEIRKNDLVATTQFFDTPRVRQLWNDLKSVEYTSYSI